VRKNGQGQDVLQFSSQTKSPENAHFIKKKKQQQTGCVTLA
jgi:hypothetical protein